MIDTSFDIEPPTITSVVRVGAIPTRWFKVHENTL